MSQYRMPAWRPPLLPLVALMDLMFLLLVFFVLQPFRRPEAQIVTSLPTAEARSAMEAAPSVAVWVRRDPRAAGGVYFLVEGVREDQPDQLHRTILAQTGGAPDVSVTLLADDGVPFDWVAHALDECRRAQVRNVDFAAEAAETAAGSRADFLRPFPPPPDRNVRPDRDGLVPPTGIEVEPLVW